MAINPFIQNDDNADTTVQSGVSLLRTAVGLSPVAAGIWYGQRELKANEAVNTPIKRATPSQALGKAQGLKARRALQARQKQADELAAKLKQGLTQSDAVKEVLQNVQEHNALLQSLSVTLEDPASGLNTTAVQQLKSQIEGLLGKATPKSIEEFANKVTSTILDSGNHETLLNWERRLNEYRKVGSQLQAPEYTIPTSGNAINEISAGTIRSRGAKNAHERRLLQVENAVNAGGNQGHKVVLNSFKEGGLQFHQAQVFNRHGKWVSSIALHGDHHFVRSGGSLNTLYSQPRYAMNARAANNFMRRGGLKPQEVGLDVLKKQGIVTSFFDYQVSELAERAKAGGIDFKQYRADMNLATQHVTRSAIGGSAFARHVQQQSAMSSQVIFGYNLNALGDESMNFIANFAAGPGREGGTAGAKRLVTGFGADKRAMIGLYEGSGFEALQQTYGSFAVDRNQLPITYREAQITGRTGMFVDPTYQVGGSTMGGVGNLDNFQKLTQGFGRTTSGALNKFMVVDFKTQGMISRGYGDKGLAVTGQSHTFVKPIEFSVLDPKQHKYAASAGFKKAVAGTEAVPAVFTAAEVNENIYMGETGTGSKMLGRDPRLIKLEVELDRIGVSYDKHMVYFKGKQYRKMDFMKLFSMSFKGNLSNIGQAGIDRLLGQDEDLADLFDSLSRTGGANMSNPALKYAAAYAPSNMFGKGSFSFVHQISASAKMLGISQANLRKRAEQIYKSGTSAFGKEATGHAIYAQAATELLGKAGVAGEHIGMVLAGVYHGAEGSDIVKGKGIKQGKYGLDRSTLLSLVESATGGDRTQRAAALAAMERGKVAFFESAQGGPSAGDWGAARVGVERRFAQTAYERFKQLGMTGQDAAETVAEVYSKKIGFGQGYAFTKEMMDFGRSVSGMRNVMDAVTQKGAVRMSYADVKAGMIDMETDKVNEFLSKQAEGTIVDFSDAPAHIRKPVQDIFGMSELYIPGTAAYQAAAGTELRVAGGQSKSVDSAFGQLVKSFFGTIKAHETTGGDPLRKKLTEFKKNTLTLMAESITNLGRGKIKGSSSPRVDAIDLTTGATLSRDQMRTGRQLFKGTGGTGVFADATYMLSELHAQKAAGVEAEELADSARMFFTGMEHKEAGKRLGSGLIRLSGRHPFISAGNIFLAQVFRDVREGQRIGDKDVFFENIRTTTMQIRDKTMTGEQFMKEVFGADVENANRAIVRGFGDIAEQDLSKQNRFFNALIRNIDQFTGGQGGGRFIVPSLEVQVGVDSKGKAIMRDIGLAPQAFMDMDGDTALSMLFSAKRSREVRALIKAHNLNAVSLANELQMRAIKSDMGKAIKEGMVAYGVSTGQISTPETKAIHDMMKEMGISQATGGLDVSLRPAHEALGDYGTDIMKTRGYRDLLGALEENVLLKAKKLDTFIPLADELGSRFTNLMEMPSEVGRDDLNRFLKEKIFHGQQTRFEVGQMAGKIKADEDSLMAYVQRSTAGHTTVVDIDEFTNDLYSAAKARKANLTDLPGTAKALASTFVKNPETGFMKSVVDGSMEAAAMQAAFDDPQRKLGMAQEAMHKMGNLFGQIDRRIMAPVALGVAGSLFAMQALGSPGYAPEPLTAPGETMPSAVSDAIAQGNLFSSPDPSMSPDSLLSRPASDYGMLDRPINMGASYMERPSSYQIRGELPSGAGISSTMQYLQNLGSGPLSGTVRLNDTRRPITRSYVDRFLGEY